MFVDDIKTIKLKFRDKTLEKIYIESNDDFVNNVHDIYASDLSCHAVVRINNGYLEIINYMKKVFFINLVAVDESLYKNFLLCDKPVKILVDDSLKYYKKGIVFNFEFFVSHFLKLNVMDYFFSRKVPCDDHLYFYNIIGLVYKFVDVLNTHEVIRFINKDFMVYEISQKYKCLPVCQKELKAFENKVLVKEEEYRKAFENNPDMFRSRKRFAECMLKHSVAPCGSSEYLKVKNSRCEDMLNMNEFKSFYKGHGGSLNDINVEYFFDENMALKHKPFVIGSFIRDDKSKFLYAKYDNLFYRIFVDKIGKDLDYLEIKNSSNDEGIDFILFKRLCTLWFGEDKLFLRFITRALLDILLKGMLADTNGIARYFLDTYAIYFKPESVKNVIAKVQNSCEPILGYVSGFNKSNYQISNYININSPFDYIKVMEGNLLKDLCIKLNDYIEHYNNKSGRKVGFIGFINGGILLNISEQDEKVIQDIVHRLMMQVYNEKVKNIDFVCTLSISKTFSVD